MLRMTVAMVLAMSVVIGAQNRQTAPPRPPLPLVPLKMFVPLAHARYFGNADLWLQNRGSDVIPVSFTWTVDGRTRVSGPTMTLEAFDLKFLDFASLLPPDVTLGNVTALEMRYQGRRATYVSAWMTFYPAEGSSLSQALDVPVNLPEDQNSATLDTVWPAPRGNERAIIAISNMAAEPATVVVHHRGQSETIKLDGYGSHLLNRTAAPRPGQAEWIRIETKGAGANPIRAAGFVRSVDDRIPHLLRFHDASDALVDDLFATGVRARNTNMTLALANVSDIAQTAVIAFFDPSGGNAFFRHPVHLPFRSVQLIDINARHTSEWPSEAVAIRIDGDGPKGSLLANLQAVDRTTGLGYEASFSDVLKQGFSAGTYPWRLDGDYQGTFTVANFGTAGSFTWSNRIGAEQYAYGVHKIAAGVTYTMDLRVFRDSERIDASPQRRVMPREVLFGHLHWSLGGSGADLGLLGRLEVVSLSKRVVRSISSQ